MSERAITSGQQVLLPESTRKQRKERKVTVAVNSRDRNIGANYDSNDFRWTFRRPLKDVVSIELVNGCIPADLYNVGPAWGSFTFGETGTVWNTSIPPGQYTAVTLAAQLQTTLNGLAGKANTYTVTYSDITKFMMISASGPKQFIFYFATGNHIDELDSHTGAIQSIKCPAKLFGFEFFDYTSSGGVITPPRRMDPDFCLSRVYLHLNADNSIELNRIEMGAGRKDCFHILFMDQVKDGYYTLNKELHMPIYISSPAPIARIATLNVSIRDEFYRHVDLGSHDFTLMFEITYLD
jgi:hypothetical protein